jgi:hypothetical protein
MPVRCGHSQPAGRFAFEIELDDDCGLITHNPAVVTGFYGDDLRRRELQCAAVRVAYVYLTAREKANVRVHAQFGSHDWLHVRGPAKSRWIDQSFHPAIPCPDNIELDTPDLSMVRVLHAIQKRILRSHSSEF